MIKRPDNHIKETRSKAYILNVWAEWAVNILHEDYGVDLDITVCENNEVTDIKFPAQLKSTDKIKIKDDLISFSIDTEHLNYFHNHTLPFLFILFDNQNDKAYWIIIQDYIWDILNEKTPNWRNQKYNTIYIPIQNNILDKEQVKESINIAGNRIITEKWYKLDVGEGLGLKENLERIKEIEKIEKFETETELKSKEAKLKLSLLFINEDNIQKANIKLMEIYNLNKRDLIHLEATIALASQLNIADSVQNEKLVNYSVEGIELAKELKNTTAESMLILAKNRAKFYEVIQKVGKLLYSKQVSSQSKYGKFNLIFINKQFEEITKIFIDLNEEINDALNKLMKSNDYYLLTHFLAETLDITSMIISEYKTFDAENKEIKTEIANKIPISKSLLDILKVIDNTELDMYVKSSIAWFYYLSELPESLNLMKESLELSIKLDNKPQIRRLKTLVNIIEEIPLLLKKKKIC